MKIRYTVDELAQISDEEMVRREFDRRNLGWLAALLAGFILIVPLLAIVAARMDEISEHDVAKSVIGTLVHSVALLVVAFVRRKPRGHRLSAGLVYTFIIAETLALYIPLVEGAWLTGGALALLLSRFRLPKKSIYTLHAFYLGIGCLAAWLAPLDPGEGLTSTGATIASLVVFGVFILSAMGLQIAGTRRVRAEILDEWSVPLQNAREQVRMREELRYARNLQLSMLPDAPPALPWIDVAAASIPAAEVGGDYYDFYPSPDGERLSLIVADVAGHGIVSGLMLAAMRGGLTLLRRAMSRPAAVLEQLHDLVSHSSRQRLLSTAAVVTIDRATRTATIASAGHPPAIVRRDGKAAALELYAPPLGVRLPVGFTERTFSLGPGDVLVLHSDGVYEARNAAGEAYGLERLQRLVEAQPPEVTAVAMRETILRDLEAFRGGPQEDDVTVVVAKLLA